MEPLLPGLTDLLSAISESDRILRGHEPNQSWRAIRARGRRHGTVEMWIKRWRARISASWPPRDRSGRYNTQSSFLRWVSSHLTARGGDQGRRHGEATIHGPPRPDRGG